MQHPPTLQISNPTTQSNVVNNDNNIFITFSTTQPEFKLKTNLPMPCMSDSNKEQELCFLITL